VLVPPALYVFARARQYDHDASLILAAVGATASIAYGVLAAAGWRALGHDYGQRARSRGVGEQIGTVLLHAAMAGAVVIAIGVIWRGQQGERYETAACLDQVAVDPSSTPTSSAKEALYLHLARPAAGLETVDAAGWQQTATDALEVTFTSKAGEVVTVERGPAGWRVRDVQVLCT
jgi:hypothetical protein